MVRSHIMKQIEIAPDSPSITSSDKKTERASSDHSKRQQTTDFSAEENLAGPSGSVFSPADQTATKTVDYDKPWRDMSKDERIAAIREGVRDGLSAAQIAARLKYVSRNAIIGYARRNQLRLANPPAAKRSRPARIARLPVLKLAPNFGEERAPEPGREPVMPEDLLKPDKRRVAAEPDLPPLTTFRDLEDDQCSWVRLGDDSNGFETPMCGRKREKGRWCTFHQKRGTKPLKDPKGTESIEALWRSLRDA
ncbi:MAG: GcrA family cell cycle regulator [Pseudomonadota bacterium]